MTGSFENINGPAAPCRYTFTVFTPTYNRAHTLHRVYESLQKQTFRDFEWLILDDGSIDGTPKLVNSWQNKADFLIRYSWQENKGINATINRGVKDAQGRFFLIIGSDDSFVPETLERFYFYWNAIPEDQQDRFVGVSALCKDQSGRLIGSGLPSEVIDSDSIEIRYKHKIKGEMWGFLRTEILRLFPFPVIPGSKFVPESLIWNAIAQKYKTRFINVPLRVYWSDESNDSNQLTKTPNPGLYAKGLVLWYQSKLTNEINWIFNAPGEFFCSAVHYGRFSFHAGVGISGAMPFIGKHPGQGVMVDYAPCCGMGLLEGPKVRFGFGKNWNRFLSVLNEDRIKTAELSLMEMFEAKNLEQKSFLDIGSGSGLFSLAARRMGARVFSFDFDPDSVACTLELKRRYFPDDPHWQVEKGSVLDQGYLKSLGTFDLVYSWGVLHHTGAMWPAMENVLIPLKVNGQLYIAVYNDQGLASRFWTRIKKAYNQSPLPIRGVILLMSFIRLWGPTLAKDLLTAKPFHSWRNYGGLRGMSPWVDLVDWVGGYPFETARPETVVLFYQGKGLRSKKLKTCGQGRGCNEFVFVR